MLPGIYNTVVQMEMNYHEPTPDNLEAYGQKHGSVIVLPTLRDRLTLRVGQLLITIGQKLTASSTKNMRLSKDLV
jgi:hypothetical protein